MTKAFLLVFLVWMLSFPAFSQTKNEIQINYGFPSADMVWKKVYVSALSSDLSSSKEFGLRYRREISPKLDLSTGVQYFEATMSSWLNSGGMPVIGPVYFEDPFQLISVPVLMEYGFLRYFYLALGPQIDFQLKESRFKPQNQNGLGYIVGLGGRYQVERFSLFVFPNFSRHSWIPFSKNETESRQVLEVFSVQLGIGYRF